MRELTKIEKRELTYYIVETILFIQVIICGYGILWLYTPFSPLYKTLMTIISGIILLDIFKIFIYIRWILFINNIGGR